MFQKNEIANDLCDWTDMEIADLPDGDECSIESAISVHPQGIEAVAFLGECGVEKGDLLDLLDRATHPAGKPHHIRGAHLSRKYKRLEKCLRQAADGVKLIRTDVFMRARSSFPKAIAPQNTENEIRQYADDLANMRTGWMEYLRLSDTHTYRWGVFALELRGRLNRPHPWKRIAVLLESAYWAHGVEIDVSANAVRQAEINLRSKHPLRYWSLARIESAWIKGGEDAALMQGCAEVVEWAKFRRGEPSELWRRSDRAQ
jgi:hypothetical protein